MYRKKNIFIKNILWGLTLVFLAIALLAIALRNAAAEPITYTVEYNATAGYTKLINSDTSQTGLLTWSAIGTFYVFNWVAPGDSIKYYSDGTWSSSFSIKEPHSSDVHEWTVPDNSCSRYVIHTKNTWHSDPNGKRGAPVDLNYLVEPCNFFLIEDGGLSLGKEGATTGENIILILGGAGLIHAREGPKSLAPGDLYFDIVEADGPITVETDSEHFLSVLTSQVGTGCPRAPVAMCQDVTVYASGYCQADASIDAGSYDPDGDPITLEQIPPGPYALGETVVKLVVTNSHGAEASCTAMVTVKDDDYPMASCKDIHVKLDITGNASITAADVDGGSTDNCGIASLSVSPDTFTSADIGSNPVTLTVTDTSSNVSTCTATVTVRKRGDLNGDDKVNIIDVMMCVNIILKIEPYTEAADLNDDDVVNIIDLQIMIRIILGS